jgi:hypothetical protein
MRFVPEPISKLRLTRFHRWAMLWLKWFAAFLDAAEAFAPLAEQAERLAHRWLDGIERVIVAIVILHAMPHVRRSNERKGVAEHRRKETSLSRAIIGSALRRALRPKDLRQRIRALAQNIDGLVARVLRRLPYGLTRRRPILARREMRAISLPEPRLSFTAPADTS